MRWCGCRKASSLGWRPPPKRTVRRWERLAALEGPGSAQAAAVLRP
jgi:hypothetical protein